MTSAGRVTPSIRFLERTVLGGLTFMAADDTEGDAIFVHSRELGFIDRLSVADIDGDKTIEEVAQDWLDENRSGWHR